MGTTEIRSSRVKYVFSLATCLLFVAVELDLLRKSNHQDELPQLGLLFFGLGAVVFLWLLIRPQRLLLDEEGFTLSGGFVRLPKKVYWRDIDRFFVYRLPRGGKLAGYNTKPGVRPLSLMGGLARSLGADGALPKGWQLSPEKLVETLNRYHRQATSGE